MRAMKDSGIEWIGEIPENWETIRFKFLHNGMNTGEAIDKEHWTSDETDLLFYTAGLNPIRTSYKDFPEWKFTKKNDLLLARNGTPYVYYPAVNACYTDHIIRADMKESVNRRFVQYGLQQSISSIVVDSVSIATWSASLWNEQSIPYPASKEQSLIASFLDRQCAHIDNIIEKTKASIEEYKKLRQAVITQAVTKGVRGERPMKGTGFNWLLQIPADWTIERGKNLFFETNNRSVSGEEELLTVSQYTGVTPRSQKNVNMFEAETLEGYKICEIGDIAANTMWLWAGAIGVSEYYGVISPSYNIYRQKNDAYNSKYLDYLLRIPPIVQLFASLSTGIRASRLRLYPEQFLNIYYPLPPLYEQAEIVEYLQEKIVEVDKLITKKEQFLTELGSYKRSMIYEYVTGKKEVPSA